MCSHGSGGNSPPGWAQLSCAHGPFGKTGYGRVWSLVPGFEFRVGVQIDWPSRAAATSFSNSGRGAYPQGSGHCGDKEQLGVRTQGGALPGAGEVG